MRLADYQLRAISDLMEAMSEPEREIVLKSCTGSGKTIILTHFMDEYGKSFCNKVFVWLTPGKGDLEEQSRNYFSLTPLKFCDALGNVEPLFAALLFAVIFSSLQPFIRDRQRSFFLAPFKHVNNLAVNFMVSVGRKLKFPLRLKFIDRVN